MKFNNQLQVKNKEKENSRLTTPYYFVNNYVTTIRTPISIIIHFIGYPSWSTSTIGLYICIYSRKKIKL
jgi:hypothetical protein